MNDGIPAYLQPAPRERPLPVCAACGDPIGDRPRVAFVVPDLCDQPVVAWHERSARACRIDRLRRRLLGGGLAFMQRVRLIEAIMRRGADRVRRLPFRRTR